jgi:HSP20 family protein
MEASSVPVLGPPTAIAQEVREAREPPADIVLTPSWIYITLELPGASKETLEVTAANGHLSVHARGPDGREFHSEIELPAPVESETVTVTYRNGVLDVALPRLRGHRIRVRKGE